MTFDSTTLKAPGEITVQDGEYNTVAQVLSLRTYTHCTPVGLRYRTYRNCERG